MMGVLALASFWALHFEKCRYYKQEWWHWLTASEDFELENRLLKLLLCQRVLSGERGQGWLFLSCHLSHSAPGMARSYLCCVLSETELLRKARGRKAMCVQTASRYSKWRGSCVFGMAPALEYLCSVKRFRVVANLFLGKCWVRNSIHNLYMSRKKKKRISWGEERKPSLLSLLYVELLWLVMNCGVTNLHEEQRMQELLSSAFWLQGLFLASAVLQQCHLLQAYLIKVGS